MAIGKAVGLGMVAAIALPYILRDLTGPFGDFVANTTLHFPLSGHILFWNWLVFSIVTLAGWALLRAAETA